MALSIQLDWSTLGVLDIQDGSGNSIDVIHLRQVNYIGDVNVNYSSDMTTSDPKKVVYVGLIGRGAGVTLDIDNITSPSYANTQALIDDFKLNIAAMYAGGGGGGGITSINGVTGPTVTFPFSNVGGGGVRLEYSDSALNGSTADAGKFTSNAPFQPTGNWTQLIFSYIGSTDPNYLFSQIGSTPMYLILTAWYPGTMDGTAGGTTQTVMCFYADQIAVEDALTATYSVDVVPRNPQNYTAPSDGAIYYLTFMPTGVP